MTYGVGQAAGWRRRGASRDEFPKKAELVLQVSCASVCTGDLVAVCFVRVVLGHERGAEVIDNSPGRDPGFCTGPLAAVAKLPERVGN